MTKSSIAAKINDVTHRPSGHLQTHTYRHTHTLGASLRGPGVKVFLTSTKNKGLKGTEHHYTVSVRFCLPAPSCPLLQLHSLGYM